MATRIRRNPLVSSGSEVTISGTPAVTVSGTPTVTVSGTPSVTGPLTNTQLRAADVDVDIGAGPFPVTDNAGSLTVDGTVTANAGSGPWPVTDNGGSLTVDGTVAVTGPLTDAQLRNSAVPVSGTLAVSTLSGVVDVTPASPAANDYLPVRLTDGTTFYTPPKEPDLLFSFSGTYTAAGSITPLPGTDTGIIDVRKYAYVVVACVHGTPTTASSVLTVKRYFRNDAAALVGADATSSVSSGNGYTASVAYCQTATAVNTAGAVAIAQKALYWRSYMTYVSSGGGASIPNIQYDVYGIY